jgi:protein-L-isoaspartate(D-aspartate) O-methyltransferase
MTKYNSGYYLRSFRRSFALFGLALPFLVVLLFGCKAETQPPAETYKARRVEMVKTQIAARGIGDPQVLNAMLKVPRHEFVPERLRSLAYTDGPLPIGEDQTISQPYIVAFMTEALRLQPHDKVLEIGTGSGYQAAVLAEIVDTVYTIEIVESLGRRADLLLKQLGYDNISVMIGDGYQGWVEHAPFDAIIVTAAPDHIPEPLVEQLRVGGRMVIPVGRLFQELLRITKTEGGTIREDLLPVRFVPMTGEAEKR